jgi:hypothetical protein
LTILPANIKKADIRNINVSGISGPLLGINNVSGKGLAGAITIEAPKISAPVLPGSQPYQLK